MNMLGSITTACTLAPKASRCRYSNQPRNMHGEAVCQGHLRVPESGRGSGSLELWQWEPPQGTVAPIRQLLILRHRH